MFWTLNSKLLRQRDTLSEVENCVSVIDAEIVDMRARVAVATVGLVAPVFLEDQSHTLMFSADDSADEKRFLGQWFLVKKYLNKTRATKLVTIKSSAID